MNRPEIERWTSVLLERLRRKQPSLNFLEEVRSRMSKKGKVFMVDKLRVRKDGLFDRVFIEYEFHKVKDEVEYELSDLKEFGWLVRFQYAINMDECCPVPCLINGGYCNLFDLTDYVEVDEDFVNGRGSFVLGEENDRIEMRLSELGDFLASSIPLFIDRMMRERIRN